MLTPLRGIEGVQLVGPYSLESVEKHIIFIFILFYFFVIINLFFYITLNTVLNIN